VIHPDRNAVLLFESMDKAQLGCLSTFVATCLDTEKPWEAAGRVLTEQTGWRATAATLFPVARQDYLHAFGYVARTLLLPPGAPLDPSDEFSR